VDTIGTHAAVLDIAFIKHVEGASGGHPPGTAAGLRQTTRQGTKTRGTPGTKKVSTSPPTGSRSRKPVTTGKTPPVCRVRWSGSRARLQPMIFAVCCGAVDRPVAELGEEAGMSL